MPCARDFLGAEVVKIDNVSTKSSLSQYVHQTFFRLVLETNIQGQLRVLWKYNRGTKKTQTWKTWEVVISIQKNLLGWWHEENREKRSFCCSFVFVEEERKCAKTQRWDISKPQVSLKSMRGNMARTVSSGLKGQSVNVCFQRDACILLWDHIEGWGQLDHVTF